MSKTNNQQIEKKEKKKIINRILMYVYITHNIFRKSYWKNKIHKTKTNWIFYIWWTLYMFPLTIIFPFILHQHTEINCILTFNSTAIPLSVCFVNQCKTSDEIYRSVNFLDLSQTYLNVFRTHIFYEYVYTVWTQRAL